MLPEWITDGARVAIKDGILDRFEISHIDYLTKTQIVLTNGRRFRVTDLREVRTGRGKLVDLRDPQVKIYYLKREVAEFRLNVDLIDRQVLSDVRFAPCDAFNQITAAYRRMQSRMSEIENGDI